MDIFLNLCTLCADILMCIVFLVIMIIVVVMYSLPIIVFFMSILCVIFLLIENVKLTKDKSKKRILTVVYSLFVTFLIMGVIGLFFF